MFLNLKYIQVIAIHLSIRCLLFVLWNRVYRIFQKWHTLTIGATAVKPSY